MECVFLKRLNETVLPNVKKIEALFRKNKQDVIFARIALPSKRMVETDHYPKRCQVGVTY